MSATHRFKPALAVIPALVFLGAAVTSSADGGRWPSFQNGGHIDIPAPADAGDALLGEAILWQAAIHGYGQSSPLIWNDNVYATSVSGANKDEYHVTAFDLATGKEKWQVALPNASPEESTGYVSKAAPTGAVDADGVICYFEGGNLIALDHEGGVRWKRNLVEDHGAISARHGIGSSLEQDDKSVYAWVERKEDPYVLAIDKKTGETRWKSPGAGATTWASPRLVPVEGGRHLVLSAIGVLAGLDPDTGERLWTFNGIANNSTPSPMPVGEGRFLIGATLGRGEKESGKAAENNGLFAITRKADGAWEAGFVWRATRATSSFSSPVAHGGMAFFISDVGALYGIDLESGEEKFVKRLSDGAWATPLTVGDRLLSFGKDDRIDIIRVVGDKPEVTTWNALPESEIQTVLYAAIPAADRLILRRGDRLFAIPFGRGKS